MGALAIIVISSIGARWGEKGFSEPSLTIWIQLLENANQRIESPPHLSEYSFAGTEG